MRKSLRFLLPVLVGIAPAFAADQNDAGITSGPLFETITRMDRRLCAVFNAHNVDRLMEMTTRDLEFYQDSDGLKGYEQSSEEFKKIFAANPDLRRELVDGSIEVYPIKDYGALEVGKHRFCQTDNGKDQCNVFKFTILWQRTDDLWKVARLISYGRE